MAGKQKAYMIVTNDKFETPVICDIAGRQAVADYLGITLYMLWRCMSLDKWRGEYKAVDLGYVEEIEEFEPNQDVVAVSEADRTRRIEENKLRKHELSVERRKKLKSDYYRLNRKKEIERSKANYRRRREERLKYDLDHKINKRK